MELKEATEKLSIMLAAQPLSLVVVDEDEEYRDIISQIMTEVGFIVSEFSDPMEMLDIYRQFRFDCIILQWDIEGMMGTVIMDEVYRVGRPFASVVVSCEGGRSISIHSPFSPAAFLFKPFSAEKLIKTLLEVIGEHHGNS